MTVSDNFKKASEDHKEEQYKIWIYDLYLANSNNDKSKIKELLKDINNRLSSIDGE